MRRRLVLVVAAVLAVPAALFFLLASEIGSRWLLGMASRASGDHFSYASVRGTLLSGLTFSKLEIRAADQRAGAGELTFRWRPGALLAGRLHVERLTLARVRYAAPETSPPSAAEEQIAEGWSLPVAVQVDEVSVRDVLVRRGDEERRIDHVLIEGFSVDGSIVTLARLEVAADILELTAHGHVDPSPPHAVEAGVAWTLRLPDGARAEGVGSLQGNLQSIRLKHRLTGPFPLELQGTLAPLADPPAVDLSGRWEDLRWPLAGAAAHASESGAFTLKGNLRQLEVAVDASLESDAVPARRLRIDAVLRRLLDRPEATLRWTAALADGMEAAGGGTIAWDAGGIQLDHRLEKPARITARGRIGLSGEAPELALEGEWQDLAWPPAGQPVAASDSGRYRLEGVPKALRFRVDAALRSETARLERADLTLQGQVSAAAPFPFDASARVDATLAHDLVAAGTATIKGDVNAVEIAASLVQPLTLNAGGTLRISDGAPRLDLSGDWRDLAWPLAGEAEIRSARGAFTLSGPLEQLALKLEAQSSGRHLPPAEIRLDARLRPDAARIEALSLDTLGGRIRASGDVGWQPIPRWTLSVSATRLDPERYFSQWPGEISLQAALSGQVLAGTPELGIERLKVDGRLRGHPVAAAGAVSFDGAKVSARGLNLRSGPNRAEVNGEVGERLNLSVVVDAPDLSAVAPDLGGALEGRGMLTGARAQPRLAARISGSRLIFGEHGAQTLSLDLDAGLEPSYRSRLALEAGGIRVNGDSVAGMTLTGDGTPERHRLALELSGEAGTVSAKASGSYGDGRWSGTLESVLESEDLGRWRTPAPAPVSASRVALRIDRICLEQAPARVCAAGSWRAEGSAIQAAGEIAGVPLALARPLLPQGVRIEGALDGAFSAAGSVSAPTAEARIEAGRGTLFYEPGAGFPGTEFDFRDARVDARYTTAGADLRMALALENAGSMQGNLRVGPFSDGAAAPLGGRLEADFSDIGWIGAMAPRLVDVRGRLDAALDLGGTTSSPTFTGELTLSNGEADVPDLGLELRKMNLAVRSDGGERLRVEGGVSSGDGRLNISGRSSQPPGGARRVELEIKGADFEAARLPTVQAQVSPDLRLSADANLAELTGSVHIPRARVKLKELPQTAIKVSEDEVIVNAEKSGSPDRARRGPTLRVRVDLSLGNEVSFEGFGLSTGIDGKLALSGETGQPSRAQGTLSLREGRYKAYGQDLKIQTGRLLFAGPIDNPGIDVTAVRELKEVTAGIVVSGSVKSVDSRVFSEPPLPEAEAFSYLLTGDSLSAGSQTDAAKLQQAATALGLNRAQMITKQIGDMLGLDELKVGGDSVDQTSLLLGKQITPDIFIRYALGVFEQSGKLLLDYRLTDNVSVQAESGEQQGMDIIYKIEREKLF